MEYPDDVQHRKGDVKVSDLIIRCLEREGVKYVFGVPGEENEDLLFSLEKSPIRFIPTRHEAGAAFMANVYGRLTGPANGTEDIPRTVEAPIIARTPI